MVQKILSEKIKIPNGGYKTVLVIKIFLQSKLT